MKSERPRLRAGMLPHMPHLAVRAKLPKGWFAAELDMVKL